MWIVDIQSTSQFRLPIFPQSQHRFVLACQHNLRASDANIVNRFINGFTVSVT